MSLAVMTKVQLELSPREKQILNLCAKGYSSRYIGRRLFISDRTVETHLRHILDKLGVNSRDSIIELREYGWI